MKLIYFYYLASNVVKKEQEFLRYSANLFTKDNLQQDKGKWLENDFGNDFEFRQDNDWAPERLVLK